MSKGGGWIPLDKGLVMTLTNIDRPYSYIEAMFSHTLDVDNKKEWSISGYSKLWQWSRNKVRKFMVEIYQSRGHLADRKGTGKGHPISFIDKRLWVVKDRKRTGKGQEEDGTNNPIILKPKGKDIYGELQNVFLSKEEHEKLIQKFNSSTEERINKLSLYISSHGKKYKSHYATILAWARKDKPAQTDSEWR